MYSSSGEDVSDASGEREREEHWRVKTAGTGAIDSTTGVGA